MTAAALSRHKKTSCPGQILDSKNSSELNEANQSTYIQPTETVQMDELQMPVMVEADLLVEENNFVDDNPVNLDELPVEIHEDGITSGLDVSLEIAKLNIPGDDILSISKRTVTIIKLTDGRIALLHDELDLDGISFAIVPSNTIEKFNA